MAFSPEIALESLQRAHASKRLAHAYLIAGGDDTARRRLTAQLTSLALGLPDQDGQMPIDPDVRVIEPESKSRKIDIEAVRELIDGMSLRSSRAGGRKVGILLDADRLQPQAANAFLKTLEEPPGDSLLLLVTGRPENLLETILSRCLRIELIDSSRLEEQSEREKMVAGLLDGVATRDARATSRIANAYGALREFQAVLAGAKEEIRGEEEAKFEAAEDKYERKDYGDWLDEREDYHNVRANSRYLAERERLVGAVARWWQTVLHVSLGIATGATPAQASVAARLSTPEILHRLERVEDLHEWLGRNIQETLALEVAFLDVFA
jgi:DNA polymerase III subunit delta'